MCLYLGNIWGACRCRKSVLCIQDILKFELARMKATLEYLDLKPQILFEHVMVWLNLKNPLQVNSISTENKFWQLWGRGVVGELDEELDSNLDLSSLRAHPLKAVQH